MNLNVQLHPNAHGLGAETAALRSQGAVAAEPFAGLLRAEARRAESGDRDRAADAPPARRDAEPAPRAPEGRAAGARAPEREAVRRPEARDDERAVDSTTESSTDPATDPGNDRAEAASPARPRPGAASPRRGELGESARGGPPLDHVTAEAAEAALGEDPGATGSGAARSRRIESELPTDAPAPTLPEAARPVLEWLARMGRGAAAADSPAAVTLPAVAGVPTGEAGAALAEADSTAAAGVPARSSLAAPAGQPDAWRAQGSTEVLQSRAAEAHAAQSPAVAAAAAADQPVPATEAVQPVEPRHTLQSMPAVAAVAAATATGQAGPTQLALATPLQSPDFSAALAARLTTLAREGVHQAQLRLNPAEMGPISVQIVVDGSLAQIDFAAAQAGTREALQASLPALAAALHTAGLTLAGGGVFDQHPPDAGTADARGEGRRGAAHDGADAGLDAGRPAALGRPQGLLDLYA